MKVLISSILLSVTLFARVNPFEATDTFEEKKLKLLEQQQIINTQEEENSNIDIEETSVIDNNDELEVVAVKEKSNCKESYSFKPLSFVSIDIKNDKFNLNIHKAYELINQDINIPNQKFVFDFKSDESFYTKREVLCSDYFSSFIIGSHFKDGYFRVVINAKEKVKSYQSQIDVIENNILLKYIK